MRAHVRRLSIAAALLALASLLGSPVACGGSVESAARMSELAIVEVLDRIDAAVASRDVDGVMRHIAADAEIEVTYRMSGRSQMERLTVADYRQALAHGFSTSQGYEYERVKSDVSLAADGSAATVESEIEESMTVQGRRMRSHTSETAVFEPRDGRILLVSMRGVSRIR
jgi:UDP-N-acetylenolpyruvoylglucosamine reductase